MKTLIIIEFILGFIIGWFIGFFYDAIVYYGIEYEIIKGVQNENLHNIFIRFTI